MAHILDMHGNPIQREVLDQSQTAQLSWLTNSFEEHPSRGLTPQRLARILEDAERGYLIDQSDLFTDMEEKDAHIFSEISKRKRVLLIRRIHQLVMRTGDKMDQWKKIKIKGALRIPDVIRVKNFMLYKGAARFKPENIAYLIEMKFDGDSLSSAQAEAYLRIVNYVSYKFRLMETKVCRINRGERNREWLKKARQTEPVFGTIEGKIASPEPLKRALAEYHLLISEILREQQEVRRLLDPLRIPQPITLERPQINPNTAVVKAWDPKLDAERERQRERTRQGLELTLAAPLAGAAAGTVVAGTTLLSGGAALGEGVTITATHGGKIISFPAGRIAVTIAANAAIYEAAAQDTSNSKPGEPGEPSAPIQNFTIYYIAD